MEDTLWSEIMESPGEIFDIPEMQEEDDDSTFASKLNSIFDFWLCLTLTDSLATLWHF